MCHHFQERETTIAGHAKLVLIGSGLARRRDEITLALDLEPRFEVSLGGEHFFQPAYVAKCDWRSVVTNIEMVLGLAWLYAGPTAAYKAGSNSANFELTKT